jgi:hypothetical protein
MDIFLDILRMVLTNHEVIQFVGLVISALLSWLLVQVMRWMQLKLRADHLAMLQASIDKAMTLAVMRAEQKIHETGWASIETRSEVIAQTIPILEEKFKETLAANGINLNDEESRRKLLDQIQRQMPDVFTRAAASPVTPPAPVLPAAMVPPPTGP